MAYINYNANPKGLKTGDCVIRALSKATGKPIQIAEKGLELEISNKPF